MPDFPASLVVFQRRFPDEDANRRGICGRGLRKMRLQCYLDEFVFRFNRTPNTPRRLPLLSRNRPRPQAAHLPHVDHAGSSGVSLRRLACVVAATESGFLGREGGG